MKTFEIPSLRLKTRYLCNSQPVSCKFWFLLVWSAANAIVFLIRRLLVHHMIEFGNNKKTILLQSESSSSSSRDFKKPNLVTVQPSHLFAPLSKLRHRRGKLGRHQAKWSRHSVWKRSPSSNSERWRQKFNRYRSEKNWRWFQLIHRQAGKNYRRAKFRDR